MDNLLADNLDRCIMNLERLENILRPLNQREVETRNTMLYVAKSLENHVGYKGWFGGTGFFYSAELKLVRVLKVGSFRKFFGSITSRYKRVLNDVLYQIETILLIYFFKTDSFGFLFRTKK